jgi:hypothetical protein
MGKNADLILNSYLEAFGKVFQPTTLDRGTTRDLGRNKSVYSLVGLLGLNRREEYYGRIGEKAKSSH